MRGTRLLLAGLGAAALTIAARRHLAGGARGVHAPGGILVGDVGGYDTMTRRLLGGLYDAIARDVAEAVAPGDQVLEVGCGPGHLANRLTARFGLDVTGLDLDPAMIERARANAATQPGERVATFVVGDAAALPFEDASVDLVVSMLSVHHWADPTAAVDEIRRVLRPGGRALVWDMRPGMVPLHRDMPDPRSGLEGSSMRLVGVAPFRWPWRLALLQRAELVQEASGSGA